MSIVLVIIGLIVGGVLVGQDLIRAAYIRAQITQIEKFNAAVNTFYGKYSFLPGDMNSTVASANGFASRPGYRGAGDGNGLIEGNTGSCGNACVGQGGPFLLQGETAMFWSDISYANGMKLSLIDQSFSTGTFTTCSLCTAVSSTLLDLVAPTAKLGGGGHIFVYSWGGNNYYSLTGPRTLAVTVQQAYAIDKKMDDGIAYSGNVNSIGDVTVSLDGGGGGGENYPDLAANGGFSNFSDQFTASAQACFHYQTGAYSTDVNGGTGLNCVLSFKFQ